MAIVQQPIVEFPCGACKQLIRVSGDEAAVCCGQRYRLELLIHQESQTDYEAWDAEIHRQLAAGNAGQPITVPPLPTAHRYPTT